RLDWAQEQIRERGGLLLITARFVPGGRTALTLTSGVTAQPRAWFAGWIAIAAVIWATYAAVLGAVFGATFQDNHTLAFVLAFAAALTITVVIEIVRHVRSKPAEEGPPPLPCCER
ncbi:MAG: DedA family protein, partial [Ilumatobacteraceae bacterium]